MRKILIAIGAMFFAVAPALAQKKEPTPQEILNKRKAEELDKGYNDAMKRTQAAPAAASDPWATVRPVSEPKPEVKPKR